MFKVNSKDTRPTPCSKVKVHQILAKGLRNVPEKIQRKKQTIEVETKMMKKAKLQVVATINKTWQILNNRCNLCFNFSCKKKKVNILLLKIDFIYIIVVKLETHEGIHSISNKLIITISPS